MPIEFRGRTYELDVVDTICLPMMATFGLDLSGKQLEATPESAQVVLLRLREPSAHRDIAYTMASTVVDLDPDIAYYKGENDWRMRATVQEISDFLVTVIKELAGEQVVEEKPKRRGRSPAKAA